MMVSRVKEPCPFCGKMDLVEVSHYRSGMEYWFAVECMDCRMIGPISKLRGEAVNKWNKRYNNAN